MKVRLMSKAEAKQRFFALLRMSEQMHEELDLNTLVEELGVTKETLCKWTTQYSEDRTEEDILDTMNVDAMILEEVIEGPQVHINEHGVIEVVPEAVPITTPEPADTEKLAAFKKKVTGLQLLNEEVQGAAGALVSKIVTASEDEDLTARDLASLVTALTNVQNAFFNKPTTNIQVNTTTGEGKSLLSSFQARLQS